MYHPTTALKKIANLKKSTRVIQGGQGAGKTIGIEMIIQNYGMHNPNKEITIIQAELSKLKKTAMRDFQKILRSYGMWVEDDWNKTDSIYRLPNGTYFEFIGLDKADVGKGFRRDVVFFNELNKGGITLDTYIQFASRAVVTYIDFNPDRRFWLYDEIIPDADTDLLVLTHEDNEYLPYSERKQILKYKEKGFFNPELPLKILFEEENIKSKYWANKHKVYGLGITGALEGIVFDDWAVIDKIPLEADYLGSGLDFGYSNDPSVLIDVYRYNKQLIFDEVFYRTGLKNNQIAVLSEDFERPPLKKGEKPRIIRRQIYADSAEPKSIDEIWDCGIAIYGAKKGPDSIRFGLSLLQENHFKVTARSLNVIGDLNNHTWAIDRDGNALNVPVKLYKHSPDAMRYWAIENIGKSRKVDIR